MANFCNLDSCNVLYKWCSLSVSVFCLERSAHLSETFSCTSTIIRCFQVGCHFNLVPQFQDMNNVAIPVTRPVAWQQLLTTQTFFPIAYNPANPQRPIGTPRPPYSQLGTPPAVLLDTPYQLTPRLHRNAPLFNPPRLRFPFLNTLRPGVPHLNTPHLDAQRHNRQHIGSHQSLERQLVSSNNQLGGFPGPFSQARVPLNFNLLGTTERPYTQHGVSTDELLFYLFLQQAT